MSELTCDSFQFQSREKVTGAPQLLAVVGLIDIFLPVRMCRFTAVTGTIITKPTLIQQIALTSLTLDILFCENLSTSKLKPTVSGVYGTENEISESQH